MGRVTKKALAHIERTNVSIDELINTDYSIQDLNGIIHGPTFEPPRAYKHSTEKQIGRAEAMRKTGKEWNAMRKQIIKKYKLEVA